MGDLIGLGLFAVICGGLDRLRGMDTPMPSIGGKLLYGIWVAAFITYAGGAQLDYMVLMGMAALWALGASPGWGHPIGHALDGGNKDSIEPEGWQKGILLTNIPLALAFRGFMWGACIAISVFMNFNYLVLVAPFAMAAAFTAAPYIAVKAFDDGERWGPMELIRGAIFGVIIGLASLI